MENEILEKQHHQFTQIVCKIMLKHKYDYLRIVLKYLTTSDNLTMCDFKKEKWIVTY